mmetsp:Transcript_12031/g.12045  ORF Transcript_12031/g.12045 Transcript_12031/m.12045 type:complete len:147 (+) Transcript_12031:1008-1448(+)
MQLSYQNGNFIIKDLKSKFGTLVLANKFIKISKGQHSTIQIGRTVMSFTVQDLTRFNTGAFGPKNSDSLDIKSFFERDFHIPYFGMPEGQENVNLPQEDVAKNIPQFKVHSNTPVMKGTLLPPAEYQVDMERLQEEEDRRRDLDNM